MKNKFRFLGIAALVVVMVFTFVSCGGSGGNYAMVRVPGGSFQMGDTNGGGSDNEKPVHTVTLNSFSIGKYEVTQVLYESVMGNNPSLFSGGNLPVEQVTWYDAIEFCNRLSEKEGLHPVYTIGDLTVTADWNKNGYRLPTEAQWEYAAKGGNKSLGNYMYSGSDNADEVAWYGDNSGSSTHTVGTKKPNGLGIYDMSGNVWEWCWDSYEDYPNEAQTNPASTSSGFFRVLRGGGWGDTAGNVRSSTRSGSGWSDGYPSTGPGDLGFRLVRP